MSNFRDLTLTTTEFARFAKIDKDLVSQLESDGLIETVRRKVGNVDRKIVSLEGVQNYFLRLRELYEKTGTPQPPASSVPEQEEAMTEIGRHGDHAQVIQTESGSQDSQDLQAPQAPQVHTATDESGRRGDQSLQAQEYVLQNAEFLKSPNHRIQMFYNVKGGTGKSTLTAQYVMQAALLGYRVLAIDLDGQGHLTVNLDVLDSHECPTVYDILINDLPMKEAIVPVAPGLDLIPANLGLCNIEIPLNHKPRREYRLSEAIESVADQYDLIVADTNPAASILNSSMLVASELVNVVCATNPLSFHGMSLVIATIEEMEREFKRELAVKIIPNMYDNREVISQEVLGELREQFEGVCAKTVVNRCADLNEATKRRAMVLSVNSRGAAAQDIRALTEELLFS